MTTKPKLPNGISFNAYAVGADFRAFAALVFDAIRSEGLPEPGRWSTHASEGNTGIKEAVDALPRTPEAAGAVPTYIEFGTEVGVTGTIKFFPDNQGQPVCRVGLQWTLIGAANSENKAHSFQDGCVSICAKLMQHFELTRLAAPGLRRTLVLSHLWQTIVTSPWRMLTT